MDYNGFRIDEGRVTLLTFDNPRANILSTPVLNDLVRAFGVLNSTKENIRALAITGTGATFCAGADIKEMSGFGPTEAMKFARLIHRVMDLFEAFPRPVVAGVNGFALGGGLEMALSCDLVIASEKAVFGAPEINIGILPGAGGTQRLTRRLGRLKAKELIFTGRRVYAEEALGLGLINRIVPADRLGLELSNLVQLLASKPIQCLEAVKRLINSGSFEKEMELFSSMFSYEDQKRLMGEFLKKK
ncbi:MAG: enoyl-CoA hydratase/isomerase family protein [Deltaproteobacteria bacterium]|nr:enoyl-CoA hydratase/isomerase family protein [Deltaproteobacteria bacterium]